MGVYIQFAPRSVLPSEGQKALLQSEDIERVGGYLHHCSIRRCRYECLGWVYIRRIVDSVLLLAVLGRETNQLACRYRLALDANLGSGVLAARVSNLQYHLARLIVQCSGREYTRQSVGAKLSGKNLLAVQTCKDAVALNLKLDVVPAARLYRSRCGCNLTLCTIHNLLDAVLGVVPSAEV